MNELIKIILPQQVKVRKYEVDIENLKLILKEHKVKSGLTIKQISNKLECPKTLVEHWFRSDNSFSIPDEDIWLRLKELLNINTNKFDDSILTFEIRDGIFEKSNRVYDSIGLSPTLTSASAENERFIIRNKIKGVDNLNNYIKNLTKFNFNMEEVKVFDVFAGIGSLHQSLTELGIPIKITNLSEVDVDAIISYAGIHIENFKDLEFNYPTKDEMKQWLMDRNIGYDFAKQKSSIPRMKVDKLENVYKASIILNNLGDISQINYEEIEDFDLMNFSFCCFVEGTLVLTDKGYKKIEDIKEGDNVLTHTNTYQRVVKPMTNKANSIYRLKTMCSEDLMVTEEHPFYVRKRNRIANNNMPNLKRGRGTERIFSEPEWVKTKDLSKDYYVGIAINQKSELPNWSGCTVPRPYNKIKELNTIKNYFDNEDFWWVVGRYIGDGWVKNAIDHKGTDIYDLYICCAKDELLEITTVLDKLNNINNDFKYKYYEDRTVYRIRISNVEFAKFLQQFGHRAINKHINNTIIDLPKNKLKGFLDGYMSADGCYTQGLNKATSISRELIYGIGQCVAKVHNRPFSIYFSKRNPTCIIEGRTVNQNNTYQITWKDENNKQDKAFYEDGYIWCPINEVCKEEYNSLVYNMEVENDNSYTVNNIIVHNCQDISNAGKQKGLKNEDGTPTRSGLVVYGLKAIRIKKPKYIMIENVKGLIQKKFIDDFYSITKEIESLGYNCYYPKKDNGQPTCLNAKNYGIPQNRERIFVICVRKDIDNELFSFPQGFDNGLRLKDLLEDEVDEKYYLSQEIQDRFKTNGNEDVDRNELNVVGSSAPDFRTIGQRDMTYGTNGIMSTLTATDYKQPKQIAIREATQKGYAIAEEGDSINLEQPNSKTRRGRVGKGVANTLNCGCNQGVLTNDIIKLGDIPKEVLNDNERQRRVYSEEGIAPTTLARTDNAKILDNFRIRKLTPKECWRLMGFRDEHIERAMALGISDSQLYKQAGNSIVVDVLYYIFKELFKEYIKQE